VIPAGLPGASVTIADGNSETVINDAALLEQNGL
jgi:hypothetical protein